MQSVLSIACKPSIPSYTILSVWLGCIKVHWPRQSVSRPKEREVAAATRGYWLGRAQPSDFFLPSSATFLKIENKLIQFTQEKITPRDIGADSCIINYIIHLMQTHSVIHKANVLMPPWLEQWHPLALTSLAVLYCNTIPKPWYWYCKNTVEDKLY